jgi:hypothetical protein
MSAEGSGGAQSTPDVPGPATRVLNIDHVVIVVRDIVASVAEYSVLLGAPSLLAGGEEVGYHRAVFELGSSGQKIELCQPLAEDEAGGDGQASQAFRDRLNGSGEGLHNFALRVPDVADARVNLERRALPLIASAHSDTFFVHPRALSGALIQFMP